MNKETFEVGEEVLGFDGVWMYYAKILYVTPKGNSVTYRIHYIGWDKKHDATVGPDQIMKVTEEVRAVKYQIESHADEDFNPGLATDSSPMQLSSTFGMNENVLVYSSSYFYLAKICDIRETDVPYKVSYHGWRQEYNEWMPTEKIFKVTPTTEKIKTKLRKYSKYKPPRRVSKRRSSIPTEKLENEQVLEQNKKDLCVEEKNSKKSDVMFSDKSRHGNMNSTRDEDDLDPYTSKKTMRKRIVTLERLVKEQANEIADLRSNAEYHVCLKCLQMVGVSNKRKNKNVKKNTDTKEFMFVKPKDCIPKMQS